jgi:hypothetical protein
MPDLIKKNPWTSSFAMLASAGLAFVLFAPEFFQTWPVIIALAKFAAIGGLAGLGIKAMDAKK